MYQIGKHMANETMKNKHSCIIDRTDQGGTGKMHYATSLTRKYYAAVIKKMKTLFN